MRIMIRGEEWRRRWDGQAELLSCLNRDPARLPAWLSTALAAPLRPRACADAFKTRMCADPLLFLDKSRSDLLNLTADALLGDSGQGFNTLVLGQRGVGKTWMLKRMVAAACGFCNPRGPVYSLYVAGSSLEDDLTDSDVKFGPWLAGQLKVQGFPQDLVFAEAAGRATFNVIKLT